MRREVPEHVDVGLDQAEVDPHRVDEQDLAQLAAARSARGSLHRRRVAVGVVAHQHQAGCSAAASTIAAASRGRVGERLLDQHVLAGLAAPPARAARGCAPAWRSPPRRRRRGEHVVERRRRRRPWTAARRPCGPGPRRGRRPRPGPSRQSHGSCGPGWAPSSPRRSRRPDTVRPIGKILSIIVPPTRESTAPTQTLAVRMCEICWTSNESGRR